MSLSFQECLKFLKEIQFGGSQDFSTKAFHDSGAVSNLYLETSSTFMKVLSTTWLTVHPHAFSFLIVWNLVACVFHHRSLKLTLA